MGGGKRTAKCQGLGALRCPKMEDPSGLLMDRWRGKAEAVCLGCRGKRRIRGTSLRPRKSASETREPFRSQVINGAQKKYLYLCLCLSLFLYLRSFLFLCPKCFYSMQEVDIVDSEEDSAGRQSRTLSKSRH